MPTAKTRCKPSPRFCSSDHEAQKEVESHFKLTIRAIYIGVSPKHLQKYCAEYAYRYNTRGLKDDERFDRWFGHVNVKNLRCKDLIGAGRLVIAPAMANTNITPALQTTKRAKPLPKSRLKALRERRILPGNNELPQAFLPVIRKQWLKVMRQVKREQASTLDAVKIHELTSVIAEMQNLQFTTQSQRDNLDADVYLATPEQLLAWAPVCRTLYVTCNATKEQLYRMTAWMPRHGVVVQYKTTDE